jgi:hypothetical protein
MKLIKLSNLIFLGENDSEMQEFINFIQMELIPEIKRTVDENLIHDLYLEDFLDSDNY